MVDVVMGTTEEVVVTAEKSWCWTYCVRNWSEIRFHKNDIINI